ncbi:hypothetical protein [Flavobacterium sp. UBA4197]|uniref:hypothetical protein n=1 Tax=Flavobacterium sp. UBA4197 TaxID=1946546 RepID=UPI0025795685|nr:hypothetical protein [Flavobacterium sp. UBA4197]
MAFASKEKSRIKMVALTVNGSKNVTWYSPERENHRDDEYIFKNMLRRFSTKPAFILTNKVRFYDAKSDTIIREYSVKPK